MCVLRACQQQMLALVAKKNESITVLFYSIQFIEVDRNWLTGGASVAWAKNMKTLGIFKIEIV